MLAVESVTVVPAVVKRVRVHKTEDGAPKKRVKKSKEAAAPQDASQEAAQDTSAQDAPQEAAAPDASAQDSSASQEPVQPAADSQKTEDDPSLQKSSEPAAPVDKHAEYIKHVESLQEQLSIMFKSLQIAKTEGKLIQKMYQQMARDFAKKTVKRRSTTNQNTGFKMAKPISKELANFMGVPHDQLVSRAEAGAAIMKYIKEKNLQPAENRRTFIPDEYLKTIVGESESYAFLFIQKYLNSHFKQ